MGKENLPTVSKRSEIEFINERFKLGETVSQLHKMMKEVTKDEMSARTVNAACNCVTQLNQTIDMAIKAARFLSEK